MIRRLLIANRGEIAVRVARGAREMDVVPLGIYSEADARAYHLQFMDESACVGPAPASQSYLNIDAVIGAAKSLRADAVHPGYGFLSENPTFARAVLDAGLIFVGPSPEAMEAMGSKIAAKQRVRGFDVPVVPGYDGDDQSLETLRDEAEKIGFPLLVKASAGGGGRGMRAVESLDQFYEALAAAKREALAAFGSDAVLLERYLRSPRHIEFQILGDKHGTVVHLGERECSIQRRHQKIIEEAPSVALSPELRATMGAAAVRAAQSVGYENAGTCEFMLDGNDFYFLEMNARLQVEHPVTELAYAIDLVQWQLRIANGDALTIAQNGVQPRGWAIEARIYAEDPANDMLPSIGTLSVWDAPQGPGLRLDSGVTEGSEVSVYYDPMLAKLIAYGSDRAQAIARLQRALDDFAVGGVRTNIPLLSWIARDQAFRDGDTTTSFLAERLDPSIFTQKGVDEETLRLAVTGVLANGWAPWRVAGAGIPLHLQFEDGSVCSVVANQTESGWNLAGDLMDPVVARENTAVRRDGRGFLVTHNGSTRMFRFVDPPVADAVAGAGHGGAHDGRVTAPMPGKIAAIAVNDGDEVQAHVLLLVLEAMKMEHRIEAPQAGVVRAIHVRAGDIVSSGAALVDLA